MLSCQEVRELWIPFVLDEIDCAGAAQINDHLAGCPACAEEERRLVSLIESVRGGPVMPDLALRSRIRSAVASQGGRRTSRGPLSQVASLLRRPVPAYLLAAACLVGVVVSQRLLPGSQGGQFESSITRVVPSGLSAGFVVASPCETALDEKGSTTVEPSTAPSGTSGRSSETDSL